MAVAGVAAALCTVNNSSSGMLQGYAELRRCIGVGERGRHEFVGFDVIEQRPSPLSYRSYGGCAEGDAVTIEQLQDLCDEAIPLTTDSGRSAGSFRMGQLLVELMALPDLNELLPGLRNLLRELGTDVGAHVVKGVIRTAFFIEPVVLPAATTTRFMTRWRMADADPRHASAEDCIELANAVVLRLSSLATTADGRLILAGLSKRSMVAYELPVGYIDRRIPIHRADNIAVFDDELVRHVAALRLLLLDPENPSATVFTEAYKRKIAVKTYLTDRALTGAHKTNREKRWEAHPDSVQFALRHACLAIESVLVNQMCHFDGFPTDLSERLANEGLLLPMDTTRCPVTLLPFSFEEFAAEVLNPEQGRSAF